MFLLTSPWVIRSRRGVSLYSRCARCTDDRHQKQSQVLNIYSMDLKMKIAGLINLPLTLFNDGISE